LPLRFKAIIRAISLCKNYQIFNAEQVQDIVALYLVPLITNFTVSLPSTFYDDSPNKFYRTELKSFPLDTYLWLMEGDAIVPSHHYIIHPCNDIYWWRSMYHQKHCTLKRIHQGSKCLYM